MKTEGLAEEINRGGRRVKADPLLASREGTPGSRAPR
jgi:hypothetical protein